MELYVQYGTRTACCRTNLVPVCPLGQHAAMHIHLDATRILTKLLSVLCLLAITFGYGFWLWE